MDELQLELEPYVDMSCEKKHDSCSRIEWLLVVVIALKMIVSYWAHISSPLILRKTLSYDQLQQWKEIFKITVQVLRLLAFSLFIADNSINFQHTHAIDTVFLVLSWLICRPGYFIVRGIALRDSKVIDRGFVEAGVYGTACFFYILARIDNFISGFIF